MESFKDGDDIVCIWESRDDYQNWIVTLHGGIQATLLGEAGAGLLAESFRQQE